jgi:hypothetical protein
MPRAPRNVNPALPPRPNTVNPQHISFLQQSPEPSVALSGCTDVISDIPSQSPLPSHERIPSQPPPNPPVIIITPSSHQTYPEPSVALSGGTEDDGECGPNQPSNPESAPYTIPSSPTSASQNSFIIPPPLSDMSFLVLGRILSCSFVQFCSPLTGNTFQQVKSTDYFV